MHLPTALVRHKAKDITRLLTDDNRLGQERRLGNYTPYVGDYLNTIPYGQRNDGDAVYERPGYLDEDRDLQRAMDESRRTAKNDEITRRKGYIMHDGYKISQFLTSREQTL